jgi:uncharacterized protein YndB with AHSA1/START domain/DNA-binding transcriptional ArsR family regulator
MDLQQALAAMAEPTRFRIITLLAEAPRTVGEVAVALNALQPQTTKHLQVLEHAGLITVHPLGRRRIASVNRETMAEISLRFSTLSQAAPVEAVLADYSAAFAQDQADGPTCPLQFERHFAVSRDRLWSAWTDPEQVRLWWAPTYFQVSDFTFQARTGAPFFFTLREGDGASYRFIGTVNNVEPFRALGFDQSPIDADGQTVFPVSVDVAFSGNAARSSVRITATPAARSASPGVLASVELSWTQRLDNLSEFLSHH